MKFLDSFQNDYKDKLKQFKGGGGTNIISSTKEEYQTYCKGLLENYTEKVVSETLDLISDNQKMSAEDIKDKLLEKCKERSTRPNSIGSIYRDIARKNSGAKSVVESLSDIKKQYSSMDFWEKFRALGLRVFTAIFIASIIMLTSYLAKEWEIPLPLRMGITG